MDGVRTSGAGGPEGAADRRCRAARVEVGDLEAVELVGQLSQDTERLSREGFVDSHTSMSVGLRRARSRALAMAKAGAIPM